MNKNQTNKTNYIRSIRGKKSEKRLKVYSILHPNTGI